MNLSYTEFHTFLFGIIMSSFDIHTNLYQQFHFALLPHTMNASNESLEHISLHLSSPTFPGSFGFFYKNFFDFK